MIIYQDKLKPISLIASNFEGKSVLTTGVYDIIHNGHPRYLLAAKNFGLGPLVVGLHSDDFVEKRKGKRSVHNQTERAEMLSYFSFVNFIFIVENQIELDHAIRILKPHTLVVSKTTEDKENSPETMEKLYGSLTSVQILSAQSEEHSSHFKKII